jgi:hypothetical protein
MALNRICLSVPLLLASSSFSSWNLICTLWLESLLPFIPQTCICGFFEELPPPSGPCRYSSPPSATQRSHLVETRGHIGPASDAYMSTYSLEYVAFSCFARPISGAEYLLQAPHVCEMDNIRIPVASPVDTCLVYVFPSKAFGCDVVFPNKVLSEHKISLQILMAWSHWVLRSGLLRHVEWQWAQLSSLELKLLP